MFFLKQLEKRKENDLPKIGELFKKGYYAKINIDVSFIRTVCPYPSRAVDIGSSQF